MYRILSVSDNSAHDCGQRLLLEESGHCVFSTIDAAEASSLIEAADIDAILLGTALRVDDRTRLALLGVTSNIPVVCMCGLESEAGCPVVHIPPCDDPTRLLASFAELLAGRQAHAPEQRNRCGALDASLGCELASGA